MPTTRVQTTVLTFAGVDTTETARQQVAYADRNGTAVLLVSGVVEVVHGERKAGAGTIVFTIRVYSAAVDGKLRTSQDLSLAASGGQASAAGLRIYVDAGAWVTVQASAGAGHDLEVQLQVAPPIGG